MKTNVVIATLLALSITLSSCEAIAGIFKAGIWVGVIVVVGLSLIALAVIKSKNKATVNGLGNFSAKRESKNLKQKLTKQGIKMPHGYSVQKRKHIAVKTIKI